MDKKEKELFTLRNMLLLVGAFILAAVLLTAIVIIVVLRGSLIEKDCMEKANKNNANFQVFLQCEKEAKFFYIF